MYADSSGLPFPEKYNRFKLERSFCWGFMRGLYVRYSPVSPEVNNGNGFLLNQFIINGAVCLIISTI